RLKPTGYSGDVVPYRSANPPNQANTSADDEIEDAPRDVDDLANFLAVEKLPEARLRLGGRVGLLFGRVDGEGDASLHLSVHLYGERYDGVDAEFRVKRRPGRVGDGLLMPQLLPELLAQVGGQRSQAKDQALQGLPGDRFERQQVIGVDHQLADGGIEPERFDILGALLRRPVHLLGRLQIDGGVFLQARDGGSDLVEEGSHALDVLALPRLGFFERAEEHLVDSQRIRAVVAHDIVGIDDVAPGLAHLLADHLQSYVVHGMVGFAVAIGDT